MPAHATIGAFVDAAARPTVDQCPYMTPALVAGCYDHVRVCGVDHELVDAGVFVDIQDAFPVNTAVGGTVQATVTARTPQGPWAAT